MEDEINEDGEVRDTIQIGGDIETITLPTKVGAPIKLAITVYNTIANRHLCADIEAGSVRIFGYKAEEQTYIPDDIEPPEEENPDQEQIPDTEE